MTRGIRFATVFFAVVLAPLAAAAQADNFLWWLPSVVGAHSGSEQPLTYRLFEEPATLELDLVLKNESSGALSIDTASMGRSVGISLRHRDVVPVQVEWQSGKTYHPLAAIEVVIGERLELQPEAWVRWRVVVRPEQPLSYGRYQLDIDMAGIAPTLSASDGSPWRGRMMDRTTLTLVVEPPKGPVEAKMRDLAAARAAGDRGRPDEALLSLKRAADANPSDRWCRRNSGTRI